MKVRTHSVVMCWFTQRNPCTASAPVRVRSARPTTVAYFTEISLGHWTDSPWPARMASMSGMAS